MFAGAGGGGCCTRRQAGTFPFFGAGLSEPAVAVGRLGVAAFLLASGVVGLTCTAAVLACRFGLPASAPVARVWRMRRRPDGGSGGGGGGWNRVGRGRWGGGGRVHHWICAGGRTEVGIWRGPALRGMKFLGRFSFAREWRDEARCSRRPKYTV
jgi:hypothetical protein